jgi:hypothetical protein
MATTAATPSRTATSTEGRAFPLGYFVLAFALTWSFWWLAVLEARGLISPLSVPALFLGAFGPIVAAVAMTALEGGRRAALPARAGLALARGVHLVRSGHPGADRAPAGRDGAARGHGRPTARPLGDGRGAARRAGGHRVHARPGRDRRGGRMARLRPAQTAGPLRRPRLGRDPWRDLGPVASAGLLQPRHRLQHHAVLGVPVVVAPGLAPDHLGIQRHGGEAC